MKKIFCRAAGLCLPLAFSLSARAAMTSVENFESYSSSAALNAAWTTVAGTPVVTLANTYVCEGSNAMAFAYAGTSAPFTNLVKLTFSASQNWTSNTVFTFNYGGIGNSNDAVIVQFLDQYGAVLGSRQIAGGTLNPPCSVATVDISNGSAFTNAANGTGLQSVRSLQIGVVAGAANDAGTVYFDNFQVGNRGVLSILGSSVALGYGSSGANNNLYVSGGSYSNGYAGDLTLAEATNGWRVVNQSIGGNTTAAVINRFYTDEIPVHADEDQIGLSLGNEGLPGAADPQAIYNQFFTGITNLIAMSRSNNILPLIGNQYPRNAYTPNEYGYLKRMDLQLNTLDVPSANFLGATDDGFGHWVNNSFINLLGTSDGIHPNDAGYYEMFLTIVPSVFDAVLEGKPTPRWSGNKTFLRLTADAAQSAPLSLSPSLIMHSFTVSFRVRSSSTGTVASITLPGSSVHPTIEITPTGLAYVSTNGVVNNSGVSGTNGAWHKVDLAHAWARGVTWFYVDGVLAGTVSERLTPVGFVLGGRGNAVTRPGSPLQADYKNWLVYRSMNNAEEVEAEDQGNLQQASLELFAPLDDTTFSQGSMATNRAQSLSVASINGSSANYAPVASMPTPTSLIVSSNYTPAMILNWSDPGAATEDAYYVDRSTAGGAWTNLAVLPAHTTAYTDLAVDIATNYQYRVSYSLSGQSSDYAISPVVFLPSTNLPSSSGTVLIDFGPNDVTNGKITTSPDYNGNYWNNMTTVANGSSITNLVATNNQASSIAVTVTSASWAENGILNGGLLNPNPALLGIFAVTNATEDYFYINQTYGTASATQTLLISGLNPALAYNFSMFATRNSSPNVTPLIRTSTYSVTDANGTHATNLVTSGTAVNSGTNPSNAGGNDKTIVSLNGLVPNPSGQLTFSLIIGDSANFAYLGALEISSTALPPAFTVQPRSQTVRVGTTNILTAYASSSQPVSYQWYFGNTPVPGATGTNLVLANVSYADAGNYSVVATNNLGTATSAVAVVTMVPPHFPAQAILIDFGPNDGVNGILTTSPDANGNYWNNMISPNAVAQGLAITNIVTANNTTTTVGATILSTTFSDNGILNGALTTPNAALLGDFAVATATEDYFFVQGNPGQTGTIQLGGLNPSQAYNLVMFATRNTTSTDIRTSQYSVTDVNGLHSVILQTSGAGSGSAAQPYGNDDTLVSLNGLVPNASGQIDLALTIVNGGFAYLGALEITPGGIPSAVSQMLIPSKTSGGWHLQFAATPGFTYHLERASDLTGPWTDLGVVVIPTNGVCEFDDTNASSSGQAFYRSVAL